tara:strand:- start:192 stop:503 length:312 start_codon:yes stop_codon:yes gene_type:complete
MARTKGAIGRMNRDMKECIELAFQKSGGIDYLMKVAAEDHKTFCGLLARIVPASVAVSISHKFDLGQAMIDAQQRKTELIDITPATPIDSVETAKPLKVIDKK